MTPEEALAECRAAGFEEDQWIHDVRAGPCQITTLNAHNVTLVAESGTPLDAGDTDDFLTAYHKGSIQKGGVES